MNARRLLLRAVNPISRLLDRINIRVGRASLNAEQYEMFKLLVRPGDVIVTRTKGRPTNWFIPGFWSHVLMYVDHDRVCEATTPKVRTAKTFDLFVSVDDIVIMRPTFATTMQIERAVEQILELVGRPYDWYFEPTPNALYCSEAVYHAYKNAVPDWNFTTRERLGVMTVTPEDYTKADDHFELVWSSRS